MCLLWWGMGRCWLAGMGGRLGWRTWDHDPVSWRVEVDGSRALRLHDSMACVVSHSKSKQVGWGGGHAVCKGCATEMLLEFCRFGAFQQQARLSLLLFFHTPRTQRPLSSTTMRTVFGLVVAGLALAAGAQVRGVLNRRECCVAIAACTASMLS